MKRGLFFLACTDDGLSSFAAAADVEREGSFASLHTTAAPLPLRQGVVVALSC